MAACWVAQIPSLIRSAFYHPDKISYAKNNRSVNSGCDTLLLSELMAPTKAGDVTFKKPWMNAFHIGDVLSIGLTEKTPMP